MAEDWWVRWGKDDCADIAGHMRVVVCVCSLHDLNAMLLLRYVASMCVVCYVCKCGMLCYVCAVQLCCNDVVARCLNAASHAIAPHPYRRHYYQ